MRWIELFRDLYQTNLPERFRSAKTTTDEALSAFEEEVGAELPAEVRAWFLGADFVLTDEANFETLGFEQAVRERVGMLELAANLQIDPARWRDNDGVQDGKVRGEFFNAGWLPFAQDSGGNYHAIDLMPGPNGVVGQVIALEYQDGQGPFLYASSLDAYLERIWSHHERLGLTEREPGKTSEPTAADHALTQAIFDQDLEAARAALQQGADGTRQDVSGETPLYLAASMGAFDIAIEIARAFPSAAGIGEFADGYVPLTYASDPELLEVLLDAGADPNASWDGKRTALNKAAERGDLRSITLLLDAGAVPNDSVLFGAIWAGEEDAALLLVERGVSASESDRREAEQRGMTRLLAHLDEGDDDS
mgnify:CR=1 FL=1